MAKKKIEVAPVVKAPKINRVRQYRVAGRTNIDGGQEFRMECISHPTCKEQFVYGDELKAMGIKLNTVTKGTVIRMERRSGRNYTYWKPVSIIG